MMDIGPIVLTVFISPFRFVHEKDRIIMPQVEFFEIYYSFNLVIYAMLNL
jgi:adenylylsulfate kinase-like enzyme